MPEVDCTVPADDREFVANAIAMHLASNPVPRPGCA